MRSRAGARLIDWGSASSNARLVGGPGPKTTTSERDGLAEDLAQSVARAEVLVTELTQLATGTQPARAWVMSRGSWVDANLRSLERIMGPLMERLLAEHPSRKSWRSKALCTQVGGLLGYVSRKVIGQYDVFLPPDDEGIIYFVGPNVIATERKASFVPRDFRLWVSVHEVTHRAQFTSAPWLRGYLSGMLDAYLSTIDVDPKQLLTNVQRALADATGKGDLKGISMMLSVMTPEQRRIFDRMQAMMALLEGHASFVMNAVAASEIPTLAQLQRGLQDRRTGMGAMERTFQKTIGFDQKIKQYSIGEHFVREVVEAAGMDAFNQIWRGPETLPSPEEIAEPSRWLGRVRP